MENEKWIRWGFILFLATCGISQGDDLQPVGDEFNSATTQDRWLQLYQVEGWNADQLEVWDFAPSYAPGQMVMIPYTSSWFADLKGVLAHKNISGDFIFTTQIRITRRPLGALPAAGDSPAQFNASVPLGAPTRLFSLAGIFVRSPRAITHAAPEPMPVGNPVWPPGGAYATDWTPNGENYIFLSMGSAGNPGTWQYEVKTTINSTSTLYYNNYGVPTNNVDAQYVTLQLVKIGDTAVSLRKHANGPWIVENRYTSGNPDPYQQLPPFGTNVQIGITTYTDWQTLLNEGYYINDADEGSQFHHNYTVITNGQPDLVVVVDYCRFQRPPAGLTAGLLAALPTTYPGNVPATLPAMGAGAYLGDVAHSPLGLLSAPTFIEGSETNGFLEIPISLAIGASNSFSIQYSTVAGGSASTNDYTPVSGTLNWVANQTNTQTIMVPVVNDGIVEGIETITLRLNSPDGPVMLPGGVLTLDIPLYLNDSGAGGGGAPPMTNEIVLSAIPSSTEINQLITLNNYVQFTNGIVTNLVIQTNGSEYAIIPVTGPGLYTTNITLPSAGALTVQTLSLGSPVNATSLAIIVTFTNSVAVPPVDPPVEIPVSPALTNNIKNVEPSLLGLKKQVVRAYPTQTGAPLREVALPSKTFGKILAVNDFTGDGTNDFITVKGKSAHLFVASGNTFVEHAAVLPSEKGRRLIGSGDVTGDGKAELFTLKKRDLYIHDFATLGIIGALSDFRFDNVMVTGQSNSQQLLLFKGKSNYKTETTPVGATNVVGAGALVALPKGYKVIAPLSNGSLLAQQNRSQALVTLSGANFSVIQSTNYPSFPGGKVMGPH